ncbi:MAG: YbhB/YbcL family Raf kinase inhibitor-like protein [Candidatus ainarchaeum sp.]|nr:YbhB/YbcL family Raf kinase inhibitor-like protein [Candidatus ainarchaeum sp.]
MLDGVAGMAVQGKGGLRVSSPAFPHGGALPERYSCRGEGVTPPLSIRGIPPGAKSLALVVEDPDAPIGTFIHLVLWNIPVSSAIPENSMPEGAVAGVNSAGESGYFPPCPPSGTHRYAFRLFALDSKLELPPGAAWGELAPAMTGHVLAQASLTATCSKG